MDVQIEPSWKEVLAKEFSEPYFSKLTEFVKNEYTHQMVYPRGKQIFEAFNLCPFQNVKVVILGQDPYHGLGQAHGLCFSVPKGVDFPPSLRNIFKELRDDVGIQVPMFGDLTGWAKQGVFLLNATLTVRANTAGSHQKQGWETFTDKVIELISQQHEHVVFILWGSYAIQKTELIDTKKHLVLKSVHPSPLSASRGFFGNHHFSLANKYLIEHKKTPIDWGALN